MGTKAGVVSKRATLGLISALAAMAIAATPASAAPAPATTDAAAFTAHGSVGEVYVTGATEGDTLLLVNAAGNVVPESDGNTTTTVDAKGSKIFREVTPGSGYTVRLVKDGKVYGTDPFKVLAKGENPSQSFYDSISLHEGLNYVTMRDGVKVAMTVRMPLDPATLKPVAGSKLNTDQYPVYIEYSGYQTAAPGNFLNTILDPTHAGPSALLPASSTAIGAVIGPLLGFVTVSVQMRGSGCSGGAFDLFGLPTTYDGYDAVETVAAQPWTKGHKVGMGGISFSGISQLYTGGTRPPHLAAISPLSVTDDVYSATGFPGGIFNKGFAYSWITARMDDAQPAPAGGQAWAKYLSAVDPGTGQVRDQQCLDNQNLRLQSIKANDMIGRYPAREPRIYEDRSGGSWLSKVTAPVFIAGSFNDEQTGGHFTESLGGLKSNSKVWITVQNGVHVDSLGPSVITRWAEFMNLYVADRIPKVSSLVLGFSGTLYNQLADAPALPVIQSRFASLADTPTNVANAKTTFEKDPRVTVLMENGAAISGKPGALGARWAVGFKQWPLGSTEAKPTTYYFRSAGKLSTSKPTSSTSSVSYVSDPSARSPQTLTGAGEGDSWKAQPPYHWDPIAAGKGLGFTSSTLSKDSLFVGPASANLWLKSNKVNTDIQIAVSEVRPDGKETLVNNGWLRASFRKLNTAKSTSLDPFPTYLAADAANLVPNQYTLVRIPVFAFGHVFRKGSKIRIGITAPGGDRQIWDFATLENGTTTNTLSLSKTKPSAIVMPLVPKWTVRSAPGATAVTKLPALPPATALRGQPSRTYVKASNGG